MADVPCILAFGLEQYVEPVGVGEPHVKDEHLRFEIGHLAQTFRAVNGAAYLVPFLGQVDFEQFEGGGLVVHYEHPCGCFFSFSTGCHLFATFNPVIRGVR